jgi:hypothetical protein
MKIRLIPFLALLLPGLVFSAATSAEDEWKAPRMPWGAPDLQGIWTSAMVTSLTRPDELDQLVLTEAQAAHIEKEGEDAMESIDNLPEGDLQAGENVGGYNSAWLDPGTRVLRVRNEPRSSIIVDPDDGQIPYTLVAKGKFYWNVGRMMLRHNNPEERPEGERCTVGFGSTGGPPMLPVLYNNNYQFVQSEDEIFILVEMNHNVRTVRMNADPLPAAIRPWLGDSIGHWEGDTLVVRTTQFHPQQNLRLAIKHQVMMSPDSIVEERFTRIGESEIVYEFTVTDESLYTQPWRGEITLRSTEGPIYEYACHEGNYALPNILAGARQEEKE